MHSKVNKVLPVRELLKYTPKQTIKGLHQPKVVLYEDGNKVYYTPNIIKMNRFFWEVAKKIEGMKITSEYDISEYFVNGYFSKNSMSKLFNVMLDKAVKMYKGREEDRFAYYRKIYKEMTLCHNYIYNELVYETLEYSTSIDSLDLLDIQMDSRILIAIEKVKELGTSQSISELYDEIDYVLTKDPKFDNNPVAIGYRSKSINRNQLYQVLGVRGKGGDLSGSIFKVPIATSFTLGLHNKYDLIVESRAAAKALDVSTTAIQTSEYLARQLQLVCMSVEKLIHSDCGSTDYENWLVRPEIIENGIVTQPCDLPNLVGLYYFDEESGKEVMITEDRKDLIEKTIKIRLPQNCKLKNTKHICSKCFGGLSHAIFEHDNLGHVNCTSVTRDITQSILSTKHLISSAVIGSITIDKVGSEFFKVFKDKSYALLPKHIGKKTSYLELHIPFSQFPGVKQLDVIDDFSKIDPARMCSVKEMIVCRIDKKTDKKEFFPVTVSNGNRHGILDKLMLQHIATNGYRIDSNNNVIFSLENWTSKRGFMTLPEVEFSFLDLAREFGSHFKNKDIRKESPITLLSKTFDLVNKKLNVNLTLLSVMVYAFTINNREEKDFRLGRFGKKELASIEEIITRRSLSGAYGYQFIGKHIFSPTFFNDKKDDFVLDCLIKPKEYIQRKENRNNV